MTIQALTLYSQYRTFNHIYLFKTKSDQSLTLKIFDQAQKKLTKIAAPVASLSQWSKIENAQTLLNLFIQQNLIPSDFLPSTPVVNPLHDLQQLILLAKSKVSVETENMKQFTCPITLEVFEDPVIDEHGHTFERSAITEHLQRHRQTCPISRQPIASLTPNRSIKDAIEEWKKQDPIPTFALFRRENPQLAASSLKMAQAFIEAGECDDALGAYIKAFQYTKEWTNYAQLPALFERMGQKEKACLAYLYLIQYQLQDKKVLEALQTIEHCRKSYPELIQIIPLLVKLYRCTQQPTKALTCALDNGEALAKEHPQEALLLYKELIAEDPCQWKAYPLLALLLQNPREKSHILLKGACHALQKKDYSTAKSLCEQAQQSYEESFVDRLIDLELLAKQGISTEKKLHQIALIYEKKQLPSLMIKTYRMLTQIKYDPSYYDKIILGYDQIQKPEKALQWSLRWLSLLIDGQEWQQAATVSNRALQRTSQKIPLYEQQEIIYTHWHGHELSELLGKLGEAYVRNGQLSQAEKTYQKAFERFNTFEHAVALADTLIQQDKIALGVRTYYEASSLALLKDRLEDLSLCVRSIRQVDPEMKHLKLSQRMILLTQSRLLELSTEVKLLKERIPPRLLSSSASMTLMEIRTTVTPSIAFGKKDWETYFGNVGVEPPLPPDIEQILNSPCPFWPGKKVHETHLLVLVPQTVSGLPLTLKTLEKLVQKPLTGNPTQYCYFNLGKYTDSAAPPSHWMLMTRDVIEGSRSQSYQAQQALLNQKAGDSYAVPNILDATACIFMEHIRTGTWLYSDSPYTYTRCQEKYDANKQLLVGGFTPSGLVVAYRDGGNEEIGVAGWRKF